MCFLEVFKRKEVQGLLVIGLVSVNLYYTYPRYSTKKSSYRETQEKILSYITKHTQKNDIIFGGNPLFATFRQHIGSYQFIHEGVFLMMSKEEKEFIEESIITRRIVPPLITYDYNVSLIL